ncbi:hypothetical protein B5P43_18445 [Bacillus sp. SRB_336]|nr:hypothetical protein B5P43_18445 [Bacillus sp. SRB_336]
MLTSHRLQFGLEELECSDSLLRTTLDCSFYFSHLSFNGILGAFSCCFYGSSHFFEVLVAFDTELCNSSV